GWFAEPVRARPDIEATYLLILFSRKNYAFWRFNDAVSLAQDDWRRAYSEDRLFDADPPPTKEELIDIVEANARALLARGSFRPADVMRELYGDVLGIARAMHVRGALVRLHEKGLIKGDRPVAKDIDRRL